MSWLPPDFAHPLRLDFETGHHLRPIRAADVDLDYPAVMSSRLRLWSIFGEVWEWPPASMTYEQDRDDLARHEAEIEAHQSFNYAILDLPEQQLYGCVYIDPPERAGADADVSWWVIDDAVDTHLDRSLEATVPTWVSEVWPFASPRFIGLDLSWDEWRALPPR
jgi:hypothetical protein